MPYIHTMHTVKLLQALLKRWNMLPLAGAKVKCIEVGNHVNSEKLAKGQGLLEIWHNRGTEVKEMSLWTTSSPQFILLKGSWMMD